MSSSAQLICSALRLWSLDSRAPGSAAVLALLAACVALPACGAAGGADGTPDFNEPQPFQGSNPLLPGGNANNSNGASNNGASPQQSPASTPVVSNEGQANGAPIAPANGANNGSGSGMSPPSAAPSAAPPATTPAGMTPPGMMAQNPPAMTPPGMTPPATPATPPPAPSGPTPPTPPGDAFFFDDFEGSPVGAAPPLWDYFVAWNANMANPSGNASALVDDTRAVSGTHAIHFVGGQNPAQITLPLPAGMNKLYVRAKVFMTRQLGMNPGANHETLIGIRGIPGRADNEIRFGEIKGVIGTNEVPTDNISPRQDQWGMGPAVAPNQWHCIEVQFIGDQPQNQLFALVDGNMVHSVTAPDQWNNGNLGGNWMAGKFVEVMLGWHSFSGINNDVWMDDIVLSTSPIGCN